MFFHITSALKSLQWLKIKDREHRLQEYFFHQQIPYCRKRSYLLSCSIPSQQPFLICYHPCSSTFLFNQPTTAVRHACFWNQLLRNSPACRSPDPSYNSHLISHSHHHFHYPSLFLFHFRLKPHFSVNSSLHDSSTFTPTGLTVHKPAVYSQPSRSQSIVHNLVL